MRLGSSVKTRTVKVDVRSGCQLDATRLCLCSLHRTHLILSPFAASLEVSSAVVLIGS